MCSADQPPPLKKPFTSCKRNCMSPLCTLFGAPARAGGYTTQARHDGDVWGVGAPSLALTMPPFPSDSPSKAAATLLFCDESCTEIILALGPSTKLEVSAAAILLAWVLAASVGRWGGGGTYDEPVIDVGGMVWRCWRWMWRQRQRWR